MTAFFTSSPSPNGIVALIDPLFVTANRIEGVFWGCLGLVVGAMTLKRKVSPAWQGWAALGVLVVFGISDWVEATTGAWYRPWRLLAWKAACVGALLIFGIGQWRRRASTAAMRTDPTDGAR